MPVRRLFGQHLGQLARAIDTFELMTYHQVLRREPPFITEVATEAKTRTAKRVYCTVFTRPRYLDGVYRPDGCRSTITSDEVAAVLQAVADSPADGLVFRWEDYLEDLRAADDGTVRVVHSSLFRLVTASA
jgi:hypothetical protein